MLKTLLEKGLAGSVEYTTVATRGVFKGDHDDDDHKVRFSSRGAW
jgi:hypothetical protein